MTPSAKMGSTLRLFTRNGKEPTFSTSLVEDVYSRPLRALVAGGYLTMDYTGTRRVYTLTEAGRDYLEGKRVGRKKQTESTAPVPNGSPVQGEHSTEEQPHSSTTASRLLAADLEEPSPRKTRRGTARAAEPAAPAPLPPAFAHEGPLTPVAVIRMMREVRDYADAHEGVDGLLAMLRRVEDLGRRFGGLDCLRECLLAIQEFRRGQ